MNGTPQAARHRAAKHIAQHRVAVARKPHGRLVLAALAVPAILLIGGTGAAASASPLVGHNPKPSCTASWGSYGKCSTTSPPATTSPPPTTGSPTSSAGDSTPPPPTSSAPATPSSSVPPVPPSSSVTTSKTTPPAPAVVSSSASGLAFTGTSDVPGLIALGAALLAAGAGLIRGSFRKGGAHS